MKRILILASTTGYQTRVFEETARRIGYEPVMATDRCRHLDDPWGFDSPLAEVDDVRARGRRIQIRRRLSALGATATAVVVMMGGASMAMGGGGGGDATIVTEASPGRRTAETSVADADTTVTTAATDAESSTSGPAADDSGTGGCGCDTSRSAGAWWLVGVIGLARRRRRR